jgi:archaemetzincin
MIFRMAIRSTSTHVSSGSELVLCFLFFTLLYSCNTHAHRVIVIQPFNDLPLSQAESVQKEIAKICAGTQLRNAIPLPQSSYYQPRNRYRADSLIRYLSAYGSADTVLIGLTSKDISTVKNNIPDWGVMGLGYCPGNACVVSTFRLSKTNLANQFYKVAIHELGHTQGLPHCKNKSCFMRDAEGGNHLNEETDFCPQCKEFLRKKGWRLR